MWPSDLDFGIFGFSFEGRAAGGVIKEQPEDFKVIEVDPETNNPIPIPPNPLFADDTTENHTSGLFLSGRVWRMSHDHARMIRLMGKAFGVSEDQISTAGIKDANAEIVQLFSIYQPRKEPDDPTMLDSGMEIDSFHYRKERLYPGAMGGNYFDITIRECNESFSQDDLNHFIEWASEGILNFYGYQRFGAHRPITAMLGRAFASKNYLEVVNIYLGGKSSRDDEKYRKHWREHHDPDELLLIWDDVPDIERQILLQLSKRPKDFTAAARKIPQFLINISRSAFISLLFNQYLSRREINHELLQGEREIGDNIEIALPSNRWKGPLNQIWEDVFQSESIGLKELKSIKHTSRMLKLIPKNLQGTAGSNTSINVQFQLENGQYATTLLRELMQQPPSSYF